MDLSSLYPRDRCACGSWLRKMAPFAGRADNMVKLRGINVWPEAVGEVVTAVDGVAPDYFVRAVREKNRDEIIVSVVSDRDAHEYRALADTIAARIKERLGVRMSVEIVPPGALDAWTGAGVSPKLKRFRDDRLSV